MAQTTHIVQSAIDRLVSAAHSYAINQSGDIDVLIDHWDDIFAQTDYVTQGIPTEAIRAQWSDLELSEHEWLDAADITDEMRVNFARKCLIDENPKFDFGDYPHFRFGIIKNTRGLDALVVFSVRGFSSSEIKIELDGVYPSEDSFRQNARLSGYFLTDELQSLADTKRLITDQQILSLWDS
jgi:hypothetical protein